MSAAFRTVRGLLVDVADLLTVNFSSGRQRHGPRTLAPVRFASDHDFTRGGIQGSGGQNALRRMRGCSGPFIRDLSLLCVRTRMVPGLPDHAPKPSCYRLIEATMPAPTVRGRLARIAKRSPFFHRDGTIRRNFSEMLSPCITIRCLSNSVTNARHVGRGGNRTATVVW